MIEGPLRASPDEFDSIIELMHQCFPEEKGMGGIVERNPHCFVRRPETLRNHLIMKDGARVVSHVSYVDQTLLIEGCAVKAAGIAAVATAPAYRNRGLMTRLLNHAIGLMREEGYAFSQLGGNRERYGVVFIFFS